MASDESSSKCLVHGCSPIKCKPKGKPKEKHHCLFEKIKTWLNNCLTTHQEKGCTGKSDVDHSRNQVIPTRLIDVGTIDAPCAPCLVKFESREEFEKQKKPSQYNGYVALSYCWGREYDKSCLLREDTEEAFCKSLPRKLPRTIQEAIDICKRLNVRYLWVDALCIMQGHHGNSNDWQKESLRVGSYYHNAIFTIAATWAASNDDGCLPFELYPEPTKMDYLRTFTSAGKALMHGTSFAVWRLQFGHYFSPASQRTRTDLIQCGLFQRGWVLQEIALSQRVMLCTSTGVYWSCRAMIDDSRYTFKGPLSLISPKFPNPLIRGDLIQFPRDRADAWYGLMSQYSAKRLSFSDDKLPALSGLCKYVDPNNEDQYLAGIWKSSIFRGLCWLCEGPELMEDTSLRDTKIPTWSFLSTNRGVMFRENFKDLRVSKVLKAPEMDSVMIKLRYDDIHGQISDARLCLKITPVEIKIINGGERTQRLEKWNVWDGIRLAMDAEPTVEKGKLVLTFCRKDTAHATIGTAWLYLDRDPEVLSDENLRLDAFLLSGYQWPPKTPQGDCFLTLILIQTTKNPSTYTRIGYCNATLLNTSIKTLDKEKLVRNRITLV